jgi:hypothetical protein
MERGGRPEHRNERFADETTMYRGAVRELGAVLGVFVAAVVVFQARVGGGDGIYPKRRR